MRKSRLTYETDPTLCVLLCNTHAGGVVFIVNIVSFYSIICSFELLIII